jgi:deazaflavin-dependent oxidoreductase (nitroreductase family)
VDLLRCNAAVRARSERQGSAIQCALVRLIDRIMKVVVSAGLANRSTALLETIGRKSGVPRLTPVTNGLDGNAFWIVTEHGHRANYVRNIEANPRVRVRSGRKWRAGNAQLVDEDPEARLAKIVALKRITRFSVPVFARSVRWRGHAGLSRSIATVETGEGVTGAWSIHWPPCAASAYSTILIGFQSCGYAADRRARECSLHAEAALPAAVKARDFRGEVSVGGP